MHNKPLKERMEQLKGHTSAAKALNINSTPPLFLKFTAGKGTTNVKQGYTHRKDYYLYS